VEIALADELDAALPPPEEVMEPVPLEMELEAQ
jgi:hypothetical protein